MNLRGFLASTISAVLLLAVIDSGLAATRTVTTLSDGPAGSLRAQLTASAAGDTIVFAVTGTITIGNEIPISHSVIILGPRNAPLIASGNGQDSSTIFNISAGAFVAMSDLTVANGFGNTFFAGISNSGNLTLTRCVITQNGAVGISNGGTLTLSQCTVANNSSSGSGGIANGGTLTAMNSTISGNGSGTLFIEGRGGGLYNYGTATLNNCTIANNSVYGADEGGGIYSDVSLTMTSCTVTGNNNILRPFQSGNVTGGVYAAATSKFTNCIVAKNGRDLVVPSGGTLTSNGHNLIGNADNSTGWGTSDLRGTAASPLDPVFNAAGLNNYGGLTQTIALAAGSPAIDHGVASSLTTDQRGRNRPYDDPATTNGNTTDGSDIGAFEVGPAPSAVTNLNDTGPGSLRASLPDHYFGDIVTLDQSLGTLMTVASALSFTKDMQIVGPGAGLLTISGNNSTRVIDINSADVVLSGLTVAGGSDSGVHISGKTSSHGILTLVNCVISGNSGSGVLSQSFTDIRVYNSSFSNNQALGSGGAISSAGTLAITNSTFTANSAGNGAAVFSSAQTDIRNSTISGNTAGSNGGGIYHSSGLFSLTDTIVAANTAPSSGPDIFSTPTITSSYNLIGDGSGATGMTDGVNHDQVGTAAVPKDPKLDPNGLRNNGGPTPTIALLATSPAINAGDPANIPAWDQRNFGRAGVTDVGAFEFGGVVFQITSIVRSGSNINITFPGFPGETYRLERKALLTDSGWQTIHDGLIVFSPSSILVSDPNGANLGHAAYRVVVDP